MRATGARATGGALSLSQKTGGNEPPIILMPVARNGGLQRRIDQARRRGQRRGMLPIIAVANSLVFTFVAPSIRRAKS